MGVEIHLKGPIFDGSAEWMLTQGVEAARIEVAEQALEAVHLETLVFKAPTGVYASKLHKIDSGFMSRILPGILPYVRWLEGTSRRNQTTIFKGYHLFRNVHQRVEARVLPLFEERLQPVIRRLNG